MDAAEYKNLTSAPDAFLRGVLEATARVLEETGSKLARFVAALPGTPIPKPTKHSGARATDFFRVDLPLDVVSEIVQQLIVAEAAAISNDGETTPEASFRADLVDSWGRYQRWLEERIAR